MAKAFKVGEAPWEVGEQAVQPQAAAPQAPMPAQEPPPSFKVGQAPWEVGEQALPPTAAGTDQFSSGESALQGFGSGASLGYLPELQAGAEYALSRVLPESMGGGDKRSYKETLKQWREREGAIQTEDPLAYGAGAVAGSAAIPMPGATIAKGGTALARIGKAAAGGAGMGLVMNPGETEDQFKARLEQALMGGAVSGGLGAAGAGLQKFAGTFKKGREALAMKLAGGRKAHFKEFAAGSPKREKLVTYMEKKGMLKPGQSYETVLEKSTQLADEAGSKLGALYKDVSSKAAKIAEDSPQKADFLNRTNLNARQLAAKVIRETRKDFKGTVGGEDVIKYVRKEMKNLANLDRKKVKSGFQMVGMSKPQTVGGVPATVSRVPGVPGQIPPAGEVAGDVIEMAAKTKVTKETPFERLLKYRQSLDDNINWQAKKGDTPNNEQALRKARTIIDRALDRRIRTLDKLTGSKNARALKPLKEEYGHASNLKRISADRMAGEESKVNLGLLETIAGTGIAGSQIAQGQSPAEALTKGLVGGLALRQARKYGPGLTYSAMKAAESGVKLGALPLAQRLPQRIQSVTIAPGLNQIGRGIQSIPGQGAFVPWTLMDRE